MKLQSFHLRHHLGGAANNTMPRSDTVVGQLMGTYLRSRQNRLLPNYGILNALIPKGFLCGLPYGSHIHKDGRFKGGRSNIFSLAGSEFQDRLTELYTGGEIRQDSLIK